MQTFEFKSTSFLHYTVIMAGGICMVSFLIVDLKLHTRGYPFLFASVVLMFLLLYLLAERNSKQVISIGMNSSYLHLSWVKLPAFIIKENKIIPWSQIQEYHHRPDKEQDSFEIILTNAETIKFFLNHSKEQKDTLHEFYVQFARTFHQLDTNQEMALAETLSNLPKNFYQTKLGIAIAFIAGISGILFSLYALTASRLPFPWRTVCVILGFVLAYIQLVWMHNKKKTTVV